MSNITLIPNREAVLDDGGTEGCADASLEVVRSKRHELRHNRERVLRDAFRVLQAGGRLQLADVVLLRDLPPAECHWIELWTECMPDALSQSHYEEHLRELGFHDITVEQTHVYDRAEIEAFIRNCCNDAIDIDPLLLDGACMRAVIRARKP